MKDEADKMAEEMVEVFKIIIDESENHLLAAGRIGVVVTALLVDVATSVREEYEAKSK